MSETPHIGSPSDVLRAEELEDSCPVCLVSFLGSDPTVISDADDDTVLRLFSCCNKAVHQRCQLDCLLAAGEQLLSEARDVVVDTQDLPTILATLPRRRCYASCILCNARLERPVLTEMFPGGNEGERIADIFEAAESSIRSVRRIVEELIAHMRTLDEHTLSLSSLDFSDEAAALIRSNTGLYRMQEERSMVNAILHDVYLQASNNAVEDDLDEAEAPTLLRDVGVDDGNDISPDRGSRNNTLWRSTNSNRRARFPRNSNRRIIPDESPASGADNIL